MFDIKHTSFACFSVFFSAFDLTSAVGVTVLTVLVGGLLKKENKYFCPLITAIDFVGIIGDWISTTEFFPQQRLKFEFHHLAGGFKWCTHRVGWFALKMNVHFLKARGEACTPTLHRQFTCASQMWLMAWAVSRRARNDDIFALLPARWLSEHV